MHTLLIQLPGYAADGRPDVLELGSGQTATFGRGVADVPVDVPLDDPGVPRLAGHVRAVEDHWTLTNLSTATTYVVENPEGGGEFVKVAPRRVDAPVPFEFARVLLPPAKAAASFTVYAPQHTFADPMVTGDLTGPPTTSAFSLDETAKYFLVLVALCEPRLRDPSSPVIPTIPQVVQRLAPLDSCRQLTRAAATFHVEYLATTKLRVKVSGEESSQVRARRQARPMEQDGAERDKADWQRSALVSLALRFDLVREEHLQLLPTRLPRSGRGTDQSDGR